ncbi:MAG: PEGA domain-containing protein [Lachnospiraceae bacterium]|nr:PEGA domain-containing protein [Lachnospiraceae bacterium]
MRDYSRINKYRANICNAMKRLSAVMIMAFISLLAVSCGKSQANVPQQAIPDEAAEKLEINELQAHDTAVFLNYDEKFGDVKLMSVDNGRPYTVSINNLTTFEDNYGKVSVPELFETGMIVDVDVSVHSHTIKSLKQSAEAFVRRNVTEFTINPNRGVFRLDDGTNLHITDHTVVIKDDKLAKGKDISDNDILLIRGIDTELYSIKIMSGYGHLRIRGASYFEGGWVQIAGMFKPVSDEMLLDLPEGDYDMVITYKGRGGTKRVTIERGRETLVNVSDLRGDLIKMGEIIFTIRPLDAMPTVKIDGKRIDYLEPVKLEYGVYQLEISAEGYDTIKEKIAVGAELANVEIELTQSEVGAVSANKKSSSSSSKTVASTNKLPTTFTNNSSSSAVSGNSTSGNSTGSSSSSSTSSTSSSNTSDTSSSSSTGSSSSSAYDSSIVQGSRIYIDAPETAEVYFDGIYKGVVPCSFIKESGTHVITLRKDGYETRTFTVTLDDSKENETYSFSALQEE